MNWGILTTKKDHMTKKKRNLTLILLYDPTKKGITLRIGKWLRFPAFMLTIALILTVMHTVNYITELEHKVTVGQSEVMSGKLQIANRDKQISVLEDTDTKRFDQLQSLGTLAVELKSQLVILQDYKLVIDEKLGSTDKMTSDQPSTIAQIATATEVVSLSSGESIVEEIEGDSKTIESDEKVANGETIESDEKAVNGEIIESDEKAAKADNTEVVKRRVEYKKTEDGFSAEVEKLFQELSVTLEGIEVEEVSYEVRDEQVDEMLPYWESYPGVLPVADTYVTSPYGYRSNPFGYGGAEFHSGVDLKAHYQDVWATGSGEVVYSGYNNGYGYMVIIDHGYGLMTKYAHNSELLVSVGDEVNRYDVIAISGNSGRSSGPHVHYEVLLDGETQNPLDYIYEGE